MNVSDIVTRVKRTFGDESGTQITDDDIIRWINDAQNEIAQQQKLAEATGTQTTVAGTLDYALPSNFIEFKSVRYDGHELVYLTQQGFDEYTRSASPRLAEASTAPAYYTSWGNKISLYPAVEDAKTLTIYYICFPSDVTALDDELTLPKRYHLEVLNLVLANAYELDENYEAHAMKRGQVAQSLAMLGGIEQNDSKDEYPFITVRAEDL